jgi:galactokinase
MIQSAFTDKFSQLFGLLPKLFHAPGRVNLIGEHTDYNQGFVFPCAIGFQTWIAIAPRPDHRIALCSENFPDKFEFDAHRLPAKKTGNWSDYIIGVATTLQQAGHKIQGANILVNGEVPIGSGLSSSAAIEVASALAFLSLAGDSLPLTEVAKMCQKAENDFVGARVGIMDQFVSCLGREGNALLLDCRSLEYKLVPLPSSLRIVICNTMVKHELAGGEYNTRREACDQAVKILSRRYEGVHSLRDVSHEQLEAQQNEIPKKIYNRALHVISENQRVLDAVDALRAHDIDKVGRLMRESHNSLRDLYEVSCRELDLMVESAEGLPGYRGGRMTGGGFGGCTVNLVNASDADIFAEQIAARYRKKTGIQPDVYISFPANGAGVDL